MEKPKTSAPDEDEADHGDQEQKEVERVGVGRDGRGLAREDREGVKPVHQKLPKDRTNMHRYPFCSVFMLEKVVLPAELEVAPEHEEDEAAETGDRDHATDLNDAGDDERVLVGLRIVVVAVGEDVGDGRADLVVGGLDKAEQNVLGRVFDARG